MRLRQTLARPGDELGELPAHLRLVLAVPHHPRLIFYFAPWLLSRWVPIPIGTQLILAVAVEASWEVIENTPWLIERYRSQTVALDYYGDSVINSVSDTLFMVLGFLLARWWPVWLTVAVTLALEMVVGYMIHDNLTLNVLMLLWPVQSILDWQAGR